MGSKRILQGTVVSDKMDKTIVVSVERHKKHRLYHKVMAVTTRYKAHDEVNAGHLGDVVRIIEAAPTSKEKRWRLLDVITRGDVAEVRPEAIGREIEATTQVAPKAEARAEEEAAAEEDATGAAE